MSVGVSRDRCVGLQKLAHKMVICDSGCTVGQRHLSVDVLYIAKPSLIHYLIIKVKIFSYSSDCDFCNTKHNLKQTLIQELNQNQSHVITAVINTLKKHVMGQVFQKEHMHYIFLFNSYHFWNFCIILSCH